MLDGTPLAPGAEGGEGDGACPISMHLGQPLGHSPLVDGMEIDGVD